jgi:hypothetical protein
LGLNVLVLFGWAVKRVLVLPGMEKSTLGVVVLGIASYPSLVKAALYEVGLLEYAIDDVEIPEENYSQQGTAERIPPELLYNEFRGIDGFKKDGQVQTGALEDQGYLLLSIFDTSRAQSIVQLLRIRDQEVLHEWIPAMSAVRKLRYMIQHPLILDDGSLVFHPEYHPKGAWVEKIDACSDSIWRADEREYHHSIEMDSEGYFWVPSRIASSSYNDVVGEYIDDSIVRISPNGEVVFERSVTEILQDNGYGALLFGVGRYDDDAIHLNDIQPAHTTTNYWEKDDLLLSLRNISTVLLYRPSTQKIVWLKIGPWLNQHDADYFGESVITVFGNDVIRANDLEANWKYKNNNIYFLDLSNGEISTPFTDVIKKADVRTPTQGLQRVLYGKKMRVFIEETDRGRLLQVSPSKVNWEYTKVVNDKIISLIQWSRYLTEDEVKNAVSILKGVECN